jgi:excisionase family DNA binding protein
MPREAPRWATLNEACTYTGFTKTTLKRWIKNGDITAVRFGPKRIQVDLNELDALRVPINTRAAS